MSSGSSERSELAQTVLRYRRTIYTLGGLSAVLNILTLSGALYMMLVYDSVLPSRSLPTLLGLLALVIIAYAFQGLFDWLRGTILQQVSLAVQRDLAPRVRRAVLDAHRRGLALSNGGAGALRDLEQLANFIAGPGPCALIDLPWILFFVTFLFLLHPWLGVTALAGSAVLVGLTVLTDRRTKSATVDAAQASSDRARLTDISLRHGELILALGMYRQIESRWFVADQASRAAQSRLNSTILTYGGASRIARMLLQSLILTVGALLVIDDKASAGVIFASSIISGRALAPVDLAIANWRSFAGARLSWDRLNALLKRIPAPSEVTVSLPRPTERLSVEQLVLMPPGSSDITVQGVNFTLSAGEALGIIGPSGAGKSSILRALAGVWMPARGTIRLDEAAIDQWPADSFGELIGYLPQQVELLEGTVGENIARFDPHATSTMIVAAARAAAVHELIVRLPQGYDTPVGIDGAMLSAGQNQRIGLARALYGDPFIVLLDEPNSNLDADGEDALSRAILSISARGGISIIVAHRTAALAHASHVLVIKNGRQQHFGARDETLARATASQLPGNPVALVKPQGEKNASASCSFNPAPGGRAAALGM